ncbi:MAG: hypothetical protein J4G14_04890 [Dehalococcoidia bacterium]|nr:hypothetical protein [Dehalococcoidia bacterium]
MHDSSQLMWDPIEDRFLATGNKQIDKSAADWIRDTMHQLITEAEVMLFWCVGLLRNLPEVRRDLESSEHLLDSLPVTVVMSDPEDYEFDGNRAMDLFVPKSRVLEAFSQGGEVEITYGKAFVISIYHMWDELSRPKLGRALGVKSTKDVKADLMGEWRYLRNWIVHQHQSSEDEYFANAKTLTGALELNRGHPQIRLWVLFGLAVRPSVMQVRLDQN